MKVGGRVCGGGWVEECVGEGWVGGRVWGRGGWKSVWGRVGGWVNRIECEYVYLSKTLVTDR